MDELINNILNQLESSTDLIQKGLLGKAVLWHRQNGNTGILTIAAVRSDSTNASTLVGIKWKEIR